MIGLVRVFIFYSLLCAWTVYGESKVSEYDSIWTTKINDPEVIGDKLQEQLVYLHMSLQECKSLLVRRKNVTNLIKDVFEAKLPVTQAKECLFQNVEQAGDKICESQKKLDEHFRMDVNYDNNKDQALEVINRVQIIEKNYKDELFNEIFEVANQMGKKPNSVVIKYLRKEAHPDYENFFNKGIYTNCYFHFYNYSLRQNEDDLYKVSYSLKK